MTTHSLHDIAAIVSRSGFTGTNVAAATALAMHVSNGDDAYDYLACIDPLIHERGLFALNVGQYAPGDQHKLYDPYFSARELNRTFKANNSSWEGHRAQPVALTPERISQIHLALRSRIPTTPIEAPSKLSQVAYTHRIG